MKEKRKKNPNQTSYHAMVSPFILLTFILAVEINMHVSHIKLWNLVVMIGFSIHRNTADSFLKEKVD